MLKTIENLEQARNFEFNTQGIVTQGYQQEAIRLANSYDFARPNSETSVDCWQVMKYAFESQPPIKKVHWEHIKERINDNTLHTFGQLHHNSVQYLRYVQDGWTEKLRPDHPIGGGSMDFMNYDDEYQWLSTVSDHPDCNQLNPREENTLSSCYYHAAKAHWLVNNIQKEGLRHPIQGHTHKSTSASEFGLTIHPGSIRCRVMETLDDNDLYVLVTDFENVFDEIEPFTFEEMMDMWGELGNNKGNLSAIFVDGKIEWSLSSTAGLDFRYEVFDFNRKVTKLTKKKPVNIYLGYDSSHSEVYDVAEASIHHSIEKCKSGGVSHEFFNDYKIEVKKLDINAISEYTRPYANQSTEFTYSRFLIPYLENYEGFSFFIDDDYIWQWSPTSLFYFLDPEHAIACVQYQFDHHDETKMDGEKNVSYPKKLWSSMMIFNNGHEDCKKLTPEVVNTASGQYLHQFEWTDQISEIPGHKIATEGYDSELLKTHHAVHYTRGGPWIKDMDYSNINMLELYKQMKNKLPKSN